MAGTHGESRMSARCMAVVGTALSAALALSGCVAAVVPLAAAGAIARSKPVSHKDRTPAPPPSSRVPIFAPGTEPPPSVAGNAALSTTQPSVATLAPLPVASPAVVAVAPPQPPLLRLALAPSKASPTSDFAGFASYAIAHAADAPGDARLAALVDPKSLTDRPHRLGCGAKPAAVAIDLDPASGTFDPADPPSPAPGLAEELARMRGAGVVIFWKSALGFDRADKVYTVLRAVGLDPDRTDRLLLARGRDGSKDARLIAAARDWCFVALAGDRKSDFLEALDYLRDPEGPIAQAVQPLYGAGWFLTPTPID